jgi:uncharacterized protein YbcI
MMENALLTSGQLERKLSQILQSLYRQQFGQLPRKIACHLFDDKVAIVAENTITDFEKILLNNSQVDLAHSVRSAINKAFTNTVREKVINILELEITDLISDSVLDTGYLGLIVFLSDRPKVRVVRKERRRRDNNTLNKTVKFKSTINSII